MNTQVCRFTMFFVFIFVMAGLFAGTGWVSYQRSGAGDILARTHSKFPGARDGVYVEDLDISIQGNTLTLIWHPTLEGLTYAVYSAPSPEGPFTQDVSGAYMGNTWSTQITSQKKFFYVARSLSYVEGGTFNNGLANVTVSSFYISKYETTQNAYEIVMGTSPSQNFGVGPDHPVYSVTWFDAIEFCNRYSILEGYDPCYSYLGYGTDPDAWPAGWNQAANHTNITCAWENDGYRLPTEMEWEFAARGGNLSQGFIYSGSDSVDNVAWYSANSGNLTHEAGTKEPNELGIYDMSGNVREICWDIHADLPTEDQTDPHGPESGSYRLLRNGGRISSAAYCEVTYRAYITPNGSSGSAGFRVCRSAPEVPMPVFDPPPGAYGLAQPVDINCSNPAAVIHYTTNGSEPDENSPIWTNPIVVSSNLTIKAKAYLSGMKPSQTSTGDYSFNNLIFIAGGTFNNGTSNVTLSSFYLYRFELTQSEYEFVMGSNPASQTWGIGPNLPVYNVNWMEALAFCNHRSIQEGITPCYSYSTYGTDPDNWPYDACIWPENHHNFSCDWNATGYRLPTEAEWEYAARGGISTLGYTYSGSNDLDEVAWWNTYNLHQIGGKLPNELGIYDMSGNMAELCWDIHGDYPTTPQTNPHGPSAGDYRVKRGGYFQSAASTCEVDSRTFCNPALRTYSIGFRLCRKSLAP